jgi:hypothetical protein
MAGVTAALEAYCEQQGWRVAFLRAKLGAHFRHYRAPLFEWTAMAGRLIAYVSFTIPPAEQV